MAGKHAAKAAKAVKTDLAKGKSGGKDKKKKGAIDAALLQRVEAALGSRDFTAANRLLGDAYRRSPGSEFIYQFARVAAAEGRLLGAQDLARRYLAEPGRLAEDATTQEAQRIVKLPRPESPAGSGSGTGSGEVQVLSDPGAFVLVDDRLVGVLPLTLPLLLSGGVHTVTLEFPGRKLSSPVQVLSGRVLETRFNPLSGAVVFTLRPALLLLARPAGAPLSEDAERAFAEVAQQSAQSEQLLVLRSDAALAYAPQLATCLETSRCQRQLARENKVDYVLVYKVAVKDDEPQKDAGKDAAAPAPASKTWELALTLRLAGIEEPASGRSRTCAKCSLEQAALALKEALTQVLAEGLHRPHGTLELSSEPTGAEIRIGEESVGNTPCEVASWVGSQALVALQSGYVPGQRTIEVTADARLPVQFKLQPLDKPKEPPPPAPIAVPIAKPPLPISADAPLPAGRLPRPRWRLAVGGMALAIGGGLLGFGISGLVTSNQCVMQPAMPMAPCRQLFDTAAVGGGLTAAGGALLITGALLIAIPGPTRR